MSKKPNTTQSEVPEGYLRDAQGRLVPMDLVKPLDIERDKLVHEIVAAAGAVQGQLQAFQTESRTAIEAFVEKAAKKYQTKMGGEQGNLSLVSYDGRYKVVISIAKEIYFNEQLNVAKKLIDECLADWSDGANHNLVAVIEHAFETDSEGNAIPNRILGLKSLNIKDTKWKRAMRALNESQQIGAKKPQLRLYEKDVHGEFKIIPMDMNKLLTMEVRNAA